MKNRLTELHTEPFTTEREWTVDGIPVLSATVVVPQPIPAASKAARRIRQYYQLQCRAFLKYCQKWILPQAEAEYRAALESNTPLPCFRAELEYHITYQKDGLWSLYTQSRETTLPGRTLLTRHGDTWDLRTGYPVPLSSFFPSHFPWKRKLLSHAAEEIQRQEDAGISLYHESWRQDLRKYFNPQNFYLTEEGLVFFFPMYAIAPSMEGLPSFLYPYER